MDALASGGARSVPALVRGLRHPDGEVVMFSAGVLARTGSPAAIPHLVSLIDHEDINVVQQVIDGLRRRSARPWRSTGWSRCSNAIRGSASPPSTPWARLAISGRSPRWRR